ncbi:unnamed protein product, partial [Mesorhabditis belari]|uniref:Uncharacterized protein n=1 Tax=Mesorhabditis belari TaxID=2138241 RepID=A0AAF3E9R1_9BILA
MPIVWDNICLGITNPTTNKTRYIININLNMARQMRQPQHTSLEPKAQRRLVSQGASERFVLPPTMFVARDRTLSPAAAPVRRNKHDTEATPERIRRMACLYLSLHFISSLCKQPSAWNLVPRCFFDAFAMQYDAQNRRRIQGRVRKLELAKKVGKLRRKVGSGNRSHIPSPFAGARLRYARLVAHLDHSPLINSLVGWKSLCQLAQVLCEPLRIIIANAKISGEDKHEACKPLIDKLMADDDFWRIIETWHNSEGLPLVNILQTQLNLMNDGLAKAWKDGLEENDEDDLDGEGLDDDDEDDSGEEAETDHQGDSEEI